MLALGSLLIYGFCTLLKAISLIPPRFNLMNDITWILLREICVIFIFEICAIF
jgi:hypothetical protein